MKFIARILALIALQTAPALAQDTLHIGYFSEWPLPAHYGQASGAYDNTEWHVYDSSVGLYGGLANGDIQIALSQGIVPFLMMAKAGPDFQIVDIAVSYPGLENCVVSAPLAAKLTTPNALQNARVALPMGTTVHFGLLKQLAQLRVNPLSLVFLDMPPAPAAAALASGKADIACGWGPALDRMLDDGALLLPTEGKDALGVYIFDSTVIRASFGADNPEVVARFLKTTNDLNVSFAANPDRMIPKIAESMNMTEGAVRATMSGFIFPSVTDKTSGKWLGGGTQNYLAQLGAFFVEQGTLDSSLTDFAASIDNSYLQTAKDLPLIDAE